MPRILINSHVGRVVFLPGDQIATENETYMDFDGEGMHISFVAKGQLDGFASTHKFSHQCDSLCFSTDTTICITDKCHFSPRSLRLVGTGKSRVSFMCDYEVETLDVQLFDSAYVVSSRRPVGNVLPVITARRATCMLIGDSILSRLVVTHTLNLKMSNKAIAMVVLEPTLRSLVFSHPNGTPIACFYNAAHESRRVQCASCPSREGCRCQFDTVKGAREFFTRHMELLGVSTIDDFSMLPPVTRPSRALTAL